MPDPVGALKRLIDDVKGEEYRKEVEKHFAESKKDGRGTVLPIEKKPRTEKGREKQLELKLEEVINDLFQEGHKVTDKEFVQDAIHRLCIETGQSFQKIFGDNDMFEEYKRRVLTAVDRVNAKRQEKTLRGLRSHKFQMEILSKRDGLKNDD